MGEWQPIETAPKDSTYYFVSVKSDVSGRWDVAIGRFGEDGFYFKDGCELDGWNWTPTHWMPLPEPPKEPPSNG